MRDEDEKRDGSDIEKIGGFWLALRMPGAAPGGMVFRRLIVALLACNCSISLLAAWPIDRPAHWTTCPVIIL